MDMKAKGVIAALPAIEPAIGKDGPQMGFNTANAISEALERAGFKVVDNADLTRLRSQMEEFVAMFGTE